MYALNGAHVLLWHDLPTSSQFTKYIGNFHIKELLRHELQEQVQSVKTSMHYALSITLRCMCVCVITFLVITRVQFFQTELKPVMRVSADANLKRFKHKVHKARILLFLFILLFLCFYF